MRNKVMNESDYKYQRAIDYFDEVLEKLFGSTVVQKMNTTYVNKDEFSEAEQEQIPKPSPSLKRDITSMMEAKVARTSASETGEDDETNPNIPPWEESHVLPWELYRDEYSFDPLISTIIQSGTPLDMLALQVLYSNIPKETWGTEKAIKLFSQTKENCSWWLEKLGETAEAVTSTDNSTKGDKDE